MNRPRHPREGSGLSAAGVIRRSCQAGSIVFSMSLFMDYYLRLLGSNKVDSHSGAYRGYTFLDHPGTGNNLNVGIKVPANPGRYSEYVLPSGVCVVSNYGIWTN